MKKTYKEKHTLKSGWSVGRWTKKLRKQKIKFVIRGRVSAEDRKKIREIYIAELVKWSQLPQPRPHLYEYFCNHPRTRVISNLYSAGMYNDFKTHQAADLTFFNIPVKWDLYIY